MLIQISTRAEWSLISGMNVDDKRELYAWACSEIRKHVENGSFGNITISMANGKISNLKEEMNIKPPVDAKKG